MSTPNLERKGKVQFKCPGCDFTVITPFGAEDAAAHMKLHAERNHNNDKVLRARISKTELLRLQ